MKIQVNGEQRELADQISLTQLISILKLAEERIAVELNHVVVRRGDWANTILREGDRVEIVHFVGGGETTRRDTEAQRLPPPPEVVVVETAYRTGSGSDRMPPRPEVVVVRPHTEPGAVATGCLHDLKLS